MGNGVDNFIEEQLELIDEQIQKIDNHKVMRAATRLIEQKNKLMAARRALLGVGNKLTASGGNRVTREEVVEFMDRDPTHEWDVGDLAEAMGHSPEVIRGHLNRGKDERFTKLDNGKWILRDPETEDDDDE